MTAGFTARRTILSALAGPNVSFSVARRFLGGQLKRSAFNDAKERRAKVLDTQDYGLFAACFRAGKRKTRCDTLEETCPRAIACVLESIDYHTQPSPNLQKTNHVRQSGFHVKSEADNSLRCVQKEACQTISARYIIGTKADLYNSAMEDLEAAVLSKEAVSPGVFRQAHSVLRRRTVSAVLPDEDEEWTPPNGQRKRAKQAVATKEGGVGYFFAEVKTVFSRYAPHARQFKQQRRAFKKYLADLRHGEVLLVAEFQEQLAMGEQDKVQSQHWQHESVIILPVPIYFRWGEKVWSYSFQVIGDDRTQDSAWVQHVMSILLNDETDKDLHFEWHYFGSNHGKSSSDSEGSVTKTAANNNITNQSWAPNTPRELFELLQRDLGFNFVKPTPVEELEFFQSKTNNRGTQQVLVMKMFCRRDGSEERKALLVTKKTNTLCGRKYIFVKDGDVTSDFRGRVYSARQQIHMKGC
eukprot:g16208.t1